MTNDIQANLNFEAVENIVSLADAELKSMAKSFLELISQPEESFVSLNSHAAMIED